MYLARKPPMTRVPMSGDPISDLWDTVSGVASDVFHGNIDPSLQSLSSGTTVTSDDFDSTTYPGICKPKNFPALYVVEELQRQLNRVAQVKGFSKVGVDGAVGPATVQLFAQVQQAAGGDTIMGDPSSCIGVAADADVLSDQVHQYADSLGAPASVSPASQQTKRTVISSTGQEVQAPPPPGGIAQTISDMSTGEKVLAVGMVGAIGWALFMRKRHGRRSSRRSRR